jgi:acetyl esterase
LQKRNLKKSIIFTVCLLVGVLMWNLRTQPLNLTANAASDYSGNYTRGADWESEELSGEQLEKRINEIRTIEADKNSFSGVRKVTGQELLLNTDEGKIRVLTYNMNKIKKLPLFINIHGGGFIAGSPDTDDSYMMNIAENANVKIMSIDYSLSPQVKFPVALHECYAVVKYAKEHALKLRIDPNNIAVGGHSAGGNLTAALSLLEAERNLLGLKCIILDYPLLDMDTDPALKPRPIGCIPPALARLFHASYREKEDSKNPLVSPIFATTNQLKSFPPTLIITASQDSLCQEGEEFRDKLIQAGITVTHKRFEGCLHGFTHTETAKAQAAWQLMIDHLRRYLH